MEQHELQQLLDYNAWVPNPTRSGVAQENDIRRQKDAQSRLTDYARFQRQQQLLQYGN